jgi:Phage integrase family
MPRSEKPRITPLSVIEVQDLASAMPERCRAMVITQAGLGLRIAELLALRVQDVDFLRRTVRIEWQLTPDGKRPVPPKTPRSRRTLPLPNVVAEALAAHIAEFPLAEDGSLFTTAAGLLYRQEYYGARVLAPAVRKRGLPAGTTSHALRHHYASLLLAAGESVVAVAERLGHENATLVLTTYGHLMLHSEDRTRRAIDAAWTVDGLLTAVSQLWQVLDSNQRRLQPTILQTAPFGHSGNLPCRSDLHPAAGRNNTQLSPPRSNLLTVARDRFDTMGQSARAIVGNGAASGSRELV